ncbi:cytochrome P450 [Trichoderma ceciliae]
MMPDNFDRLWLLLTGLVGTVVYLGVRLVRHRLKYRDLPCPPHSMLWGHLKVLGERVRKLPSGAHMQAAMTQLKLDYHLPDIFYLDLWPLGPQFLVCTSPDSCAIPTTENAFEMHDMVINFFKGNIGTSFIEATNGALWKHLHQMLTPGLTPTAVRGYHASIIEQAAALRRRFWDIAKSGQAVDIRRELGHYPFQVMAKVIFGEALSKQNFEDVKAAIDIQAVINATDNPFAKWRLGRNASRFWRRLEMAIEPKAKVRYAALQQQDVLPTKINATNLLDRMMLSEVQSGRPLGSQLTKLILENVNGLLAAGYGTTADTSSYVLMLLGAFPDKLQKLREEHDRVFDKDHDKTVEMLREQPGLIKDLAYTTAVINETLRMFPIGFSIRSSPSDITTMEYKGRSYPTKGLVVTLSSHTMHYDPKYFDDPKSFKPERFLSAEPGFPRNAYRPFERGLRSCLGQALAMDEMKMMLVMVARWFDFELKDHHPADKPKYSFTDLDTKLGMHAIQTWGFTAAPVGQVMMRVVET